MVKLRLMRKGAKKRPFYQIIAINSRNARNGLFIEKIGFFNPISINNKENLYINLERINHWVSCGAKLSKRLLMLTKIYNKRL